MITLNDFAPIAALDLDAIKAKLMRHDEGESWSLERANAVEFEYRRFLYLMKMFPEEPTAPTVDVDAFWHAHILHTMRYAADCQKVFGYFLHHFPHEGARAKDDEEQLIRRGERMRHIYEETFGESDVRYAGVAENTAYCSRVDIPPAYCSRVDARSAYCSRAATRTAYCSRVDTRTAHCWSESKAADSGKSANDGAPAATFNGRFRADRPNRAKV